MRFTNSNIAQVLRAADIGADPKTNGLLDHQDLVELVDQLAQITRQLLADATQSQYERDEFARRLSDYVGIPATVYQSAHSYPRVH